MEEVIAAAERYYQTQPRPTQPLASSGNAAPSHLMAFVGNRASLWRHKAGGRCCCCWDDAGSAACALQSNAQ